MDEPPAGGERQPGSILQVVRQPPVAQPAMNAPRHEPMDESGQIVFDRVRGPADPQELVLDQPGREEAERSAGQGGTEGARGLGGVGAWNEGWVDDSAGGRRGSREGLLDSGRSSAHDASSMV